MEKEILRLRQKTISFVVLFFVFLMLFTALEVSYAANTGSSNLLQNVAAGTLDITAPTNTNFTSVTAGTAANSQTNVNNVDVTDFRGNGGGWTVTANANNLASGTNTINTFAKMVMTPAQAISNLNGASSTGVTAGSANQAVGSNATNEVTVFTATASNGMGAYQLDNNLLNLTIDANVQAGDYTATMTLTVA